MEPLHPLIKREMWRAVASKQQLSDIPEQVSMGGAAHQTPAHAMVCKGLWQEELQPSEITQPWKGLAWNFSLYTTIKHPGMKLNQVPSLHSLYCMSAIARKTPMANRKNAGENNWDSKQFLLLWALLCLSHLRSKEHQALAVYDPSFQRTFFFLNWTEMRSIFLWQGAVSHPWFWVFTSQNFPEKKKWKWYLVGQPLFWEGILVTSNQSGCPAWNSPFLLVDFWGSCRVKAVPCWALTAQQLGDHQKHSFLSGDKGSTEVGNQLNKHHF